MMMKIPLRYQGDNQHKDYQRYSGLPVTLIRRDVDGISTVGSRAGKVICIDSKYCTITTDEDECYTKEAYAIITDNPNPLSLLIMIHI